MKRYSINYTIRNGKYQNEKSISGNSLKELQDEFNEKILAKKNVIQFITVDNYTGETGALYYA